MKPRDFIICATLLIIYVLVTGCKSVTPVTPVATNSPPLPPINKFILTTNKVTVIIKPPYTNQGLYVWPGKPCIEWYDMPVYSFDLTNWSNFGVAFCSWTNNVQSFYFNIEAPYYTILRFTSHFGWNASWIPSNIVIQ